MLEPGALVDKWRVDRALGEGGMGAVFACTDSVTGRIRAAVKIAKAGSSDDYKQRFLREVEALHSLQHKAIVRVTDWGEDPNHACLYLAMDLLDGQDLEKRMAQGPMSVAEARSIFDDVTDALAHAHESGVCHRDLKPANIMVTSAGAAKLVDFGIAVQESQNRMTAAGEVPGTPAYIAPEVLVGEVDPAKADLYAMGLIIYECLRGELAFPDKPGLSTTHQLMHLMSAKSKQEPFDLGEGFPDALRNLIWRTTHPDPSQRPATAADLARELAAAWDGGAVAAAPAPVASAPAPAAHASPAPPLPAPPSSGAGRWLVLGALVLLLCAVIGVGAVLLGGGAVLMMGGGEGQTSVTASLEAPEPEAPVVEAPVVEAEAEDEPGVKVDEDEAPSRTSSSPPKPAPSAAPTSAASAPSAPMTRPGAPTGALVPAAAVAAPASTARIAFGGADFLGSYAPSAIEKVVRARRDALLKCYTDELAHSPGLGGTIKINFTLQRNGRADDTKVVKKTSFGSPGLETCLVGEFSRMRYKARDSGSWIFVTYTLTFSP